MSTVNRRLAGAVLALSLLAPVAWAAPTAGRPWWQELWEVLTSFRPDAFWSLGPVEKEGPGYDPLGQPFVDKEGPSYDPLGQPTQAPAPPSTPSAGP